MGRLIVGLTGAFGSGTTFLADNFFAKMGFTKYSLSEVLKAKYAEETGAPHASRHDLGISFAKMTAQSWQKKLTTGIFLNAIKMRTLL